MLAERAALAGGRMTKRKARASEIKMIPIEKINILNPRVRNQKVFLEIATNMTQVGMKRPITVTPSRAKVDGKEYDLICGQGRIEAFVACGQTEIPAIVIDASEEQALIMSLVENLARRQHRATTFCKESRSCKNRATTPSRSPTRRGWRATTLLAS
jgi:ParB family chromosome partitioning protein